MLAVPDLQVSAGMLVGWVVVLLEDPDGLTPSLAKKPPSPWKQGHLRQGSGSPRVRYAKGQGRQGSGSRKIVFRCFESFAVMPTHRAIDL
jgi:hypothetical protein